MNWYVLQVMTGLERAVCAALADMKITACAPSKTIVLRRDGKEITEDRLLFPSYVFVELLYTADVFHRMRKISGIIRFLGMTSGAPECLCEETDHAWIDLLSGKTNEPLGLSTVEFDEFGTPRIVSGPLLELEPDMVKIDRRQRRAKIAVNLLGTQRYITLGIVPKKRCDPQ